jgi:hypothetical protein
MNKLKLQKDERLNGFIPTEFKPRIHYSYEKKILSKEI